MRKTHRLRTKNKTPKRKPKRKTAVRSQIPKLHAREEWPLPRRTPKRKTRTFKRKIRAKGSSGLDELKWDVVERNKYNKKEIDVALTLLELSESENKLHLTESEKTDIATAMYIDPYKLINLYNDKIFIQSNENLKKTILLASAREIIESEIFTEK